MIDSLAGVVLAAGPGTRLLPLTRLRPKALCPVANVALVDLALARARSATADVAANVHHHREMLEDLHARGVADNPHVRQLAAQIYIESKCLQYLGYRAVSKLMQGQIPGPEGSVAKLAVTNLGRKADKFLDALRGPGTMLHDRYTDMQLWIPAMAIAGGTDEVLRNIIGERVLGLPGEPRVDKDVPFRDVPVGTLG